MNELNTDEQQPVKVMVTIPTEQSSVRWLRYPDAAEYIGFSESWLRKAVMRRRIPHHKVGRRVLFLASDLDSWIVDHRAVPTDSAA